MGNILDSGMSSFSGEVDPEMIISDCQGKIDHNNKEIKKIEVQIEELEQKVEKTLSESEDPFELMKKKTELSKRVDKLEKHVVNLKELIKNAEEMRETTDEVEKQNIMKRIVGKHGHGNVGGGILDYVGKGNEQSNDIFSLQREQEDIERMFSSEKE